MPLSLVILLVVVSFALGGALAGGLVWIRLAGMCGHWQRLWRESERLRAEDRAARAGANDGPVPANFFRPPPLRAPRRRTAPNFMRRLIALRDCERRESATPLLPLPRGHGR